MSDVLALPRRKSIAYRAHESTGYPTSDVLDIAIMVRGKRPSPETIRLAEELLIPILVTKYILFETAGLYAKGIVGCVERVDDERAMTRPFMKTISGRGTLTTPGMFQSDQGPVENEAVQGGCPQGGFSYIRSGDKHPFLADRGKIHLRVTPEHVTVEAIDEGQGIGTRAGHAGWLFHGHGADSGNGFRRRDGVGQ